MPRGAAKAPVGPSFVVLNVLPSVVAGILQDPASEAGWRAAPRTMTTSSAAAETRRWASLASCLFIGAVVGSAYGFSVYSRAIKQRFGLAQGELDTIPAVSAAMGLFSALLGAVHDAQGPLISTVVGGCTVTIGMCLQFLLITLLPVPSQGSGDSGSFSSGTGSGISTMTVTVLVAAASSLTYLGGAILTAAVFATICVNFPRHKGTVVGLDKAWLGLCSGFTTQLFVTFVPDAAGAGDTRGPTGEVYSASSIYYLLFLAAFAFLGTLPVAPFMRLVLRQGSSGGSSKGGASRCDSGETLTPSSRGLREDGGDIDGGREGGDGGGVGSNGRVNAAGFEVAVEEAVLVVAAARTTALDTHDNGDGGDKNDAADDHVERAPAPRGDFLRLLFAYIDVCAMAVLVTCVALAPPTSEGARAFVVAGILVLWLAPIVLPITTLPICGGGGGRRREDWLGSGQNKSRRGRRRDSHPALRGSALNAASAPSHSQPLIDPLLDDIAPSASSSSSTHTFRLLDPATGVVLRQRSTFEAVRTAPGLLLLWVSVTNVGAGFVVTNNLAQISGAMDLAQHTATCVTIFSVAQSLGRGLVGLLSDRLVRAGHPRPLCLAVAALLLAGAHGCLIAASRPRLIAGVALAGAGFGATWTLMVVTVSELFGPDHMGSNYMLFDGMGAAVGNLGLAMLLSQSVYTAHIADPSRSETCLGAACFRDTHLVVVGLLLTSVAAACGFAWSSRGLYREIGVLLRSGSGRRLR